MSVGLPCITYLVSDPLVFACTLPVMGSSPFCSQIYFMQL